MGYMTSDGPGKASMTILSFPAAGDLSPKKAFVKRVAVAGLATDTLSRTKTLWQGNTVRHSAGSGKTALGMFVVDATYHLRATHGLWSVRSRARVERWRVEENIGRRTFAACWSS